MTNNIKFKEESVMVLLLLVFALITSTKSRKEMDSYNLPVALVAAGMIDIMLRVVYCIVNLLF